MKRKNKSMLKNADKVVNVCLTLGAVTGLALAPHIVITKDYDANSIYNRKMQAAKSEYHEFFEGYQTDLKIAIDSNAKTNTDMTKVEDNFMEHISKKYKEEAAIESEIIGKYKEEKQVENTTIAITGFTVGAIGAYIGQKIGNGINATRQAVADGVNAVKNGANTVKNFSFKRKEKHDSEMENDDEMGMQ